jgi:hypothetical protein
VLRIRDDFIPDLADFHSGFRIADLGSKRKGEEILETALKPFHENYVLGIFVKI